MALGGMTSTCINHVGVEAVGRCKQCGRPYCNACKVIGPTGLFCSTACKEKHEIFVQRAAALDAKRGPIGIKVKLRKLFNTVVFIVILAIILGVLGTVYTIPILSDLVLRVRDMIGV